MNRSEGAGATADLGAGYAALHEGLAVVDIGRDVVRVTGPDAERYLQGQLSQDVAALAPAESAWSLVLAPQGKLDVFVRVYRVAADEFLLDTDAGMGEALVGRLLRFRLRTKADIQRLDWRALAVRGPLAALPPGAAASGSVAPGPLTAGSVAPGPLTAGSVAPGSLTAGSVRRGPVAPGPLTGAPVAGTSPSAEVPSSATVGSSRDGAVAVPFRWNGLNGYDLLGPAPAPPEGSTFVDAGAYEVARIEAGFPRHGAELDERTIPAEAGLVAESVSFTKGCYTGQELVARIDSRGSNVPRHLRGLLLSGPAEAGWALHALGAGGAGEPAGEGEGAPKELGRLTSVALSPRLGWVALGYVGRAVETGQTLGVRGGVEAQVQLLPFATPAQ
jgi:folate-binding protein YgfZ